MPAFSLCISRIGLTPHKHTYMIANYNPMSMIYPQFKKELKLSALIN